MNKMELIQNLIDMAKKLPLRDENKLDVLRRRTEMIIRNVFGNNSKYLKDLKDINFHPIFGPCPDKYYDECWISGKSEILNLSKTMLDELTLFGETQKAEKVKKAESKFSGRIFIVHGHDKEMLAEVARTLDKLDLNPIILHEQPNEGRTIIEKFTDYSDVNYAIVLLSPDDYGYSKDQSPDKAKPRARQNVIFELGFFIGKLGRKHVLVLFRKEENFEFPSDYKGVLYKPYDESGVWKYELADELKAIGYETSKDKLP